MVRIDTLRARRKRACSVCSQLETSSCCVLAMAFEKLTVNELCDWLAAELKDDIGEESVEVLRRNKV